MSGRDPSQGGDGADGVARSAREFMLTTRNCLHCGTLVPVDWLSGHCPKCLAERALKVRPREPQAEPTGARFPRPFGVYELLGEIARGGMGVVYRARQRSPNRLVALKMLLAGEFAAPQSVRRFQQESSAVARLQHPNIVTVHEVGECEGQPYFTMAFVEGRTLAELAQGHPLPARQAAVYLKSVAEAVHYAHSRGVLHRDLKPSSILVDSMDQPRVTDFGLAGGYSTGNPVAREDAAGSGIAPAGNLTLTGQALGSPGYSSPEQAFGLPAASAPASDIYSLGAVLYYLLTGRAPFQGETVHEVLLQVRMAEAIPPRKLNPSVPVELETIAIKCLEKEPGRRYATAAELAEELGRFLRDEPIQARPLGIAGRMWKFCKRRPALAGLSASVLLLALVLATGSLIVLWRLEAAWRAEQAERERSETANRSLRETVRLLELRRAEDFFIDGDTGKGAAYLASILRRDPSNHIAASRLVSALVHRDWALPSCPPLAHQDNVQTVCFSPDGRLALTASRDHTAELWDVDTGRPVAVMRHDHEVHSARFGRDGRRVVTASADGTARLWDGQNGAATAPPLRHRGEVYWAEFSPDGETVVTASADGFARLWNAATGALLREMAHGHEVVRVCFDPAGDVVATGTEAGSIAIWRVDSGEPVLHLEGHRGRITALAFNMNGSQLVSASTDGAVQLWHRATAERLGSPLLPPHGTTPAWHAGFSPDGHLVLAVRENAVAMLFDVEQGSPVGPGLYHEAGVRFGAFSPDGASIATASADHTARLWATRDGRALCQPLRAGAPVVHAAFSPDNRRLAVASSDGTARIWNIQPHGLVMREFRHSDGITSVCLSADGRSLLTTSFDRTARLWDWRRGQAVGDSLDHAAPVLHGEFSPDGSQMLTACADGHVRLWDTSTRRLLAKVHHAKAVQAARFCPDGQRFVTASADGTARLWDSGSGRPVTPPLAHEGEVLMACFSPNGRCVATASTDHSARVWDAQTGEPTTQPLLHREDIKWAAFSPDGARIVTASSDDTACIWDVRSSRPVGPPLQHQRIVSMAEFSPDGRRVATASLDRTVRIWDAYTGRALTPALQHHAPVSQLHFSPDGKRVATATWNGSVRVWDSECGEALTEWLEMGGFPSNVCFDATGQRVAAGSYDGKACVWDLPPAPTPVPFWFAQLAEAVAGIRVADRGHMERVPCAELFELKKHLAASPGSSFYHRLALWFLADPAERSASPF